MTNATLHTNHGPIEVELFDEDAPKTVENFRKLAEDGFYDGVTFHRVIPGFMAQGGDPSGRGTGGSDLPDLKAEFSREPHVRGTCSMARTPDPNSLSDATRCRRVKARRALVDGSRTASCGRCSRRPRRTPCRRRSGKVWSRSP